MITKPEFLELLRQRESEALDRKRSYPGNNITLLHDILCLCNSYVAEDRHLLYGVEDGGTVCGVEADPNRKCNADLHDMLRQSTLNRIPTVSLEPLVVHNKQEVDILTIENRPDKPFFVLKDRRHERDTLRAGVVYTRLGDTNTPLREAAPEEHIELMWRERFGLVLDPLARVHQLFSNPDDWISLDGDNSLYHRQFPEFTVRVGDRIQEYRERWALEFPNGNAHSYYVEVRYLSTLLERHAFVSCDGGRYQVPLPERKGDRFLIRQGTVPMRIAQLYWQNRPLDFAFRLSGVEVVHET